jgi:hypothetical protein
MMLIFFPYLSISKADQTENEISVFKEKYAQGHEMLAEVAGDFGGPRRMNQIQKDIDSNVKQLNLCFEKILNPRRSIEFEKGHIDQSKMIDLAAIKTAMGSCIEILPMISKVRPEYFSKVRPFIERIAEIVQGEISNFQVSVCSEKALNFLTEFIDSPMIDYHGDDETEEEMVFLYQVIVIASDVTKIFIARKTKTIYYELNTLEVKFLQAAKDESFFEDLIIEFQETAKNVSSTESSRIKTFEYHEQKAKEFTRSYWKYLLVETFMQHPSKMASFIKSKMEDQEFVRYELEQMLMRILSY